MIIILTGVSGSGKSLLGKTLSEELSCLFFEGDSFHSKKNIEKMSSGIALTDEDRMPWLLSIAAKISALSKEGKVAVFTCSALKHSYREILRGEDKNLFFIYLSGDRELIKARHLARSGHFMPASLIDSQFEILEIPAKDEALHIEATQDVSEQINLIIDALL